MVIEMKKKIMIISIISIAIIAIIAMIYASTTLNNQNKEEDKHLPEISFTELEEKINNKESFILVLTKTNCSYCIEYKPVLKKVLTEYDIYAYELYIDKLSTKENGKLKDIANISGTPATIFIEQGEEKNTATRLYGSQPKDKIISRLKAMGYIK